MVILEIFSYICNKLVKSEDDQINSTAYETVSRLSSYTSSLNSTNKILDILIQWHADEKSPYHNKIISCLSSSISSMKKHIVEQHVLRIFECYFKFVNYQNLPSGAKVVRKISDSIGAAKTVNLLEELLVAQQSDDKSKV